jgi:hypothetical protein
MRLRRLLPLLAVMVVAAPLSGQDVTLNIARGDSAHTAFNAGSAVTIRSGAGDRPTNAEALGKASRARWISAV